MKIEPDLWYIPTAPEMRVIGAKQTLAKWRHEGRGPAYFKCGSRVLYRGADLLDWLDAHRVTTDEAV